MTVNTSQAAAAYARIAAKATAPDAETINPGGESFGDIMARALSSAADIGRKSEAVSIRAVADRADLNETITAVNNAEITLKTVVAVRDKVIQAYQEIMQMPI